MAEIVQINENSWRIEDNGVRFFVLAGSEKALMIDSGRAVPDARRIAETLTDRPLMLLNTHADSDHISGNVGFERFYMSPAEEEGYRAHGGTGELIPVREGDVIDLGGRPLRIIDNPGHTPGSLAILDQNARVLIGGDAVQDGTIYMFTKRRDLSRYAESLKRIMTEYGGSFDTVWPSHGTFPVGSDLIPQLIWGAGQILSGLVKGEQITLHGNPVRLIRFPFAGFYCDPVLPRRGRFTGAVEEATGQPAVIEESGGESAGYAAGQEPSRFRPLARVRQQIGAEECVRILKTQLRGVLSVAGDDGYPYGVPLNHYYCEEDGKLYFHSGPAGHKVDAMRRHAKASFCVWDDGEREEGGWALQFRSVIVFGRIEFVDDREKVYEIARRLSRKFTQDESYIEHEIAHSGPHTLLFALVPEHMTGKLVREK